MSDKKYKPMFSGCGITGAMIYHNQPLSPFFSKEKMNLMTDSLSHRGPDSRGIWIRRPIWMGHRRLQILDLSQRGYQPMTYEGLTIVHNGEIYNFKEIRENLKKLGHRFKSYTDTEVILHAHREWGIKAVKNLDGMFAFAIWDKLKKELIVARDRMGQKPLYYYHSSEYFIFASEVRTLILSSLIPPSIDQPSLERQILMTSHLDYQSDITLVKNVKSLSPGSWIRVLPNGKLFQSQYWSLHPRPVLEKNTTQISIMLRHLVDDSVKSRLISDVPVACFLSGGLDSSILAATATAYYANSPIQCHTLSYKQGGTNSRFNSKDMDTKFSQLLISQYRKVMGHQIFKLDIKKLDLELIDQTIDLSCFNEDPNVFPTIMNYRALHHNGVKVVMNGQGADELMGGYLGWNHFYNAILSSKKTDLKERFFPSLRTPSLKYMSPHLVCRLKILYQQNQDFFNQLPGSDLNKSRHYLIRTVLRRILKTEDFLSMKFSIECRLPYMDHHIVNFLLKTPFYKHIDKPGRIGKLLIKQAYSDLIPLAILNRPKQPFPRPNQGALKAILKTIFKDHYSRINNSSLIRSTFSEFPFNKKYIPSQLEDLWQMIMLWRWEECLNGTNKKSPLL